MSQSLDPKKSLNFTSREQKKQKKSHKKRGKRAKNLQKVNKINLNNVKNSESALKRFGVKFVEKRIRKWNFENFLFGDNFWNGKEMSISFELKDQIFLFSGFYQSIMKIFFDSVQMVPEKPDKSEKSDKSDKSEKSEKKSPIYKSEAALGEKFSLRLSPEFLSEKNEKNTNQKGAVANIALEFLKNYLSIKLANVDKKSRTFNEDFGSWSYLKELSTAETCLIADKIFKAENLFFVRAFADSEIRLMYNCFILKQVKIVSDFLIKIGECNYF